MSLPLRIIEKIKNLEKSIVSYPVGSKLKQLKRQYNESSLNRDLLVVDKYGNRYYQQYSKEGIPTKRYVALNFKAHNKWDEDPTMLAWLQYRRQTPPSQEELEKIYIEQEEFERRGLEYDTKQNKLLEEYSKKRNKAISDERQETGATGIGNSFSPGKWELEKVEQKQSLTVLVENKLSEIPTWDVMECENLYGLKGKYFIDFENDDKIYMENKDQKYLAPYNERLKEIDVRSYTPELASRLLNEEIEFKKEYNNNKKKELTSIGKKMLEKKEKFSEYSKFRENYKDIFSKYNFSI